MGISETWLNDINKDYVNITGYCFISLNRVGRLGGGAGLYLRVTFNFNIMETTLILSPKKCRKVWKLLQKPAFTYHPKL